MKPAKIRITVLLLLVVGLVAVGYFGRGYLLQEMTIHQLLSENKQLKEAITNLTAEEQIGYAKVIKQETKDGKVWTTLRFVETARNDKTQKNPRKELHNRRRHRSLRRPDSEIRQQNGAGWP